MALFCGLRHIVGAATVVAEGRLVFSWNMGSGIIYYRMCKKPVIVTTDKQVETLTRVPLIKARD